MGCVMIIQKKLNRDKGVPCWYCVKRGQFKEGHFQERYSKEILAYDSSQLVWMRHNTHEGDCYVVEMSFRGDVNTYDRPMYKFHQVYDVQTQTWLKK
jgi:hypothetical protein